jgi:hypothetical protein
MTLLKKKESPYRLKERDTQGVKRRAVCEKGRERGG